MTNHQYPRYENRKAADIRVGDRLTDHGVVTHVETNSGGGVRIEADEYNLGTYKATDRLGVAVDTR